MFKRLTLSITFCLTLSGCGSSHFLGPRCPTLESNEKVTPKGVMCLACGNPSALENARAVVTILKRSCTKEPVISFLIDETFDPSFEQITELVDSLATDERKPQVILYLTNGPAQRRCKTQNSPGYLTHLCPEDFRLRLRYDAGLREDIKSFISDRMPLVNSLKALGAEVVLAPALEDNLDNEAFLQFANLIYEAAPAALVARSSCIGCYPGNQAEAYGFMTPVTNDGQEFLFPGETTGYPRTMNEGNLRQLLRNAILTDNPFLFWKASWQGLDNNEQRAAKDRVYVVPSKKDIDFVSALLADEL